MRLVRTVAFVVVALIGTGLLLSFLIGVVVTASDGGFPNPRGSLPSPRRLAVGATYAVTRECPVTLLWTAAPNLDVWLATITNGTLLGSVTHAWQLGNAIACPNPSGRGIVVTIDAIDAGGVHLAFAWAGTLRRRGTLPHPHPILAQGGLHARLSRPCDHRPGDLRRHGRGRLLALGQVRPPAVTGTAPPALWEPHPAAPRHGPRA